MPNKVNVTVLKIPTEEEILAEDYPEEIMNLIPTIQCPKFTAEGQEFLVEEGVYAKMPENFCEYAWRVIYPFVLALVSGGSLGPKEQDSDIVSCHRGIKPTVFKIERE